ncbi:TolC family outer membrane protein [Pseudomonadota bacterium AL_CKDN230030165-1A_HGKHYDSX7]
MRALLTTAGLLWAVATSVAAQTASAAGAAPAGVPPARVAPATAAAAPAAGIPANAPLTLSQAWRLTLENDPTYQAAESERDASQTNRAMGRAQLLPQVSGSLGRNKIRGDIEEPDAFGGVARTDLDYMSRTNEIRLTQTVFNWGRFAEYRQGHARADYGLAVFDTKAQDTVVRLFNRYLQALLSYENVKLLDGKLKANEQQITVAKRRFDLGEGTVTDVREAQSRRDLARADLIQAQDALIVASRELQEMIGRPPQQLTNIDPFDARRTAARDLEQWMGRAMQDNAEIRSGLQAYKISDQEIDRAFGGHLPTVDAIASRRKVSAETLSTRDQDSTTTSVGVQINVPIFSGGMTSAQVDQARFNRDRAGQELAATRERIAVEVTRQYQGVVSGAERVAALEVAATSSAEALKAVQKGFQAGTRTIVDILDAQDQLYQARLDLSKSRLQFIQARLALASAAGNLDATEIDDVSKTYFSTAVADLAVAR